MWGSHAIHFRPHLESLLEFVFAHFAGVGVWTFTGRGKACSELASLVFGPYFDRLAFVYDKHKCSRHQPSVKDLNRIWDEFPAWMEGRTLIVDDHAKKMRQSAR
eukprot:GABV01002050.1.p1 GENE.GABV01002050.1~~GABV01002050.1.p1  ORF type:complete len:104 (+),score=25.29 GABV01002050.1:317-628(+)